MKDPILTRVQHAVDAALDKKALDLDVLVLTGLTSIADYFIICSGTTERQTAAIADAIDDRLRVEDKTKPLLIEGMSSGRWVLLDYGDFIVHIFTEECRRFYGLERLWGDAPNITRRFLQESAPKANAPAR
ncbi:MAG TPA: ribosome silencing factor [Thermoanaerobaculia bacterium]|nr:ribosome silencing factor [Thermoanaerobaculia bacterium]